MSSSREQETQKHAEAISRCSNLCLGTVRGDIILEVLQRTRQESRTSNRKDRQERGDHAKHEQPEGRTAARDGIKGEGVAGVSHQKAVTSSATEAWGKWRCESRARWPVGDKSLPKMVSVQGSGLRAFWLWGLVSSRKNRAPEQLVSPRPNPSVLAGVEAEHHPKTSLF